MSIITAVRALLLQVLLSTQILHAAAKFQTGLLRIGGDNEGDQWRYLSKFAYAIGQGSAELRLRPRQMPTDGSALSFAYDVYTDDDWASVMQKSPCDRKNSTNHRKIVSIDNFTAAGEWGEGKTRQLTQVVRSRIWYFVLSRCGETNKEVFEVDYEIRMKQFDGSELGVESRCMVSTNALVLACLTVLISSLVVRCRRFHQSAGILHPVIWALMVAVLLQWAGHALHQWHLLAFAQDGVGTSVGDFIGQNCIMLSQVVCTTLLVLISKGFALGQTMSESTDGSTDSCVKVAVFVAVTHMALVAFGKMDSDSEVTHHENGGTAGCVIVALRLVMYVWFLYSLRKMQSTAGMKLLSFLQTFRLVGSLYFLSYPVTFVVAQLFAHYLQQPIMQICSFAAQICAALWLAQLFLSRGQFFDVSALGSSLLPGCSSNLHSLHVKNI